jgi:hypothetical protein
MHSDQWGFSVLMQLFCYKMYWTMHVWSSVQLWSYAFVEIWCWESLSFESCGVVKEQTRRTVEKWTGETESLNSWRYWGTLEYRHLRISDRTCGVGNFWKEDGWTWETYICWVILNINLSLHISFHAYSHISFEQFIWGRHRSSQRLFTHPIGECNYSYIFLSMHDSRSSLGKASTCPSIVPSILPIIR